jgi:hypothetical protein
MAARCIRFFVRFGYDLIRRHSTFLEQYFGTKAMASNFLVGICAKEIQLGGRSPSSHRPAVSDFKGSGWSHFGH